MYVNALDNPHVLILGHLGRSGLDFDVPTLVRECRDRGKLIEMNEATHDEGQREVAIERCRVIAETCAELGCKISLAPMLTLQPALLMRILLLSCLKRFDFPEELMACRDAQTFLGTIADAKIPASKQGY